MGLSFSVPQIDGDRPHHYPVGVDEPVGLPRVVRADKTTGLGHDQRRQILRGLPHDRTNDPTAKTSLTSGNAPSSSVNR